MDAARALDPTTWDDGLRARLVAANAETAGAAARGSRWAVATQFPASAYAADRVLTAGGTAADAFVAAVLVDCVMTPGAASLGGMVEALVRDPTGDIVWLDGNYRVPAAECEHSQDDWTLLTTTGRSALVPGTVRGLEALWRRFGRLEWHDLFVPAVHFAEAGFAAYPRLAALVAQRRSMLEPEPDAAAAYFPNGEAVVAGEPVRQAGLARTLRAIATGGADAMYLGDWGEQLVRTTTDRGGVLTRADVTGYEAEWVAPLTTSYLGWTVAAGGPTTSGSCLLRSLNTCQALELQDMGPRDRSAATLYAEMQASEYAWEPDRYAYAGEPDAELTRLLSKEEASRVACLVRDRVPAGANSTPPGTHAVAVSDSDGMVIAGAHSISWTGWGAGIFVGGVPLNAAGYHLIERPVTPGRAVLGMPNACVIASRDGETLAAGATSHGLECSLQNLNDILIHGHDLATAIGRPHWGTAEFDTVTGTNTPYLHCETNLPSDVVNEVIGLGQPIKRADGIGLGYWVATHRTRDDVTGAADPRFRGAARAEEVVHGSQLSR
jgi:gamma-glutamyltranspeptidase / glutathione hydrolase